MAVLFRGQKLIFILFFGVLGTAFIVFISQTKYFTYRSGLTQFLFGVPFLLIAVWLGISMALPTRRELLISPLCAVLLGFEVFLFLGPTLLPTWVPELYGNFERVLQCWLVISLGLISFLLTYHLSFQNPLPPSQGMTQRFLLRLPLWHRIFFVGALLLIFRLFFFYIWYQASGIIDDVMVAGHFATKFTPDQGYLWGWWFATIATLTGVSCLAAVVYNSREVPFFYRLSSFLLIIATGYSTFIEGNRGRFAIPLIATIVIFIIFAREKDKINSQIFRLQRISILLITVIISVGILWQTHYRHDKLPQAYEKVVERGFSKKGGFYVERGFDMLPYLDRLLQEIGKEEPYYWGLSYVLPFLHLIPRVYWQEKPRSVASYLKNAGPTIVGEWYANFGWIGVIVGMAFLGFCLKFLWTRFLFNSRSDFFKILYAITFATLIYQVRGDFYTVTTYWLYSSLLLILVWLVCTKAAPTQKFQIGKIKK